MRACQIFKTPFLAKNHHKNRQTTLASSWCTSWTPPTATRPPSGDPIDFTCSVALVFSATSFILEIELELLCAIRQRLNKRTKDKTGLRRPSNFHTFITSRSPVKDLSARSHLLVKAHVFHGRILSGRRQPSHGVPQGQIQTGLRKRGKKKSLQNANKK